MLRMDNCPTPLLDYPYSELPFLGGCNEEIGLGLQMTSLLPDELVDCSSKLCFAGQRNEVCAGLCFV